MRRLIAFIIFECYALLLAAVQWHVGVRTDEAKYLLDIPYPHPPFARFIMSLTDGWAWQEGLWRIILATLLVQAVWLVFSLAKDLPKSARTAACAAWLLSAAVVYQAGTVMMAPLTALQMLLFLWLLLRGKDNSAHAGLIGLLWLVSLFTAYQAVLFLPLAAAVLFRLRVPLLQRIAYFILPLILLCLYTATNPLAAASMIVHVGKDAAQTLPERLLETAWIMAIGGSVIVSILGTVGLFIRPRISILSSLLLVSAYIFLSRYDYYAILFTPLFVVGCIELVRRMKSAAHPIAFFLPVATAVMIFLRPPSLTQATLPALVMPHLPAEGTLLIAGSFGHEWQHISRTPVLRYHSRLLVDAGAVVCLVPCEEMQKQPRFRRLSDLPVEVWLKQL